MREHKHCVLMAGKMLLKLSVVRCLHKKVKGGAHEEEHLKLVLIGI